MRSLVVPLLDFVDGLSLKCDVYVIGSFGTLYEEPYVQTVLVRYVGSGKGLIVVAPDVMPSIFYVPDAPPERSRRLGAGMGHWDNHLMTNAGTVTRATELTTEGASGAESPRGRMMARQAEAVGGGSGAERRSLQLSSNNVSSVPVRQFEYMGEGMYCRAGHEAKLRGGGLRLHAVKWG